ncbi:LuxR C-terminal-related transcriptional regulator [Amycolatopsis granulosa]|uniref:LuxR C-terminal-related transcriptional regulator n=1 Tax=Amycolatopsis granulosa TaxID=185684 RepID=UPI00312CBEFF|nr:LuxR family maltose regulon positive regulatory protein [Amycolatopsis granulosa]
MPQTKIAVPDLPVHFVSRPRLLALLDRAATSPVSIVCAPAGAGKTLLLAEWARRAAPVPTAMVSLDPDDRDDRWFWSAVLDALAAQADIPHSSPLRTLGVPGHPGSAPGFLADVVDALDALPRTVALILDGVEVLGEAGSRTALEALVRHRPAGLRLVLSGRCAPPVPLARLRLTDRLAEVGAGDLRFTPAEARALFSITGARVPPGALDRLLAETGGWAVALRLAAASAVREGGLDGFLAGHDRALAEYLDQEVLAGFDDDVGDFLRLVSVRGDTSPEPAAALTGRSDAAAVLHDLAATGGVVRESDGTDSYRILPLLRTYLLADLGRRDPGLLAAQHRRVAAWFEGRGDAGRALEHSARAADTERVVALLRTDAVRLFLAGEHAALRQALGVLDDGQVARSPHLALIAAALNLETGGTGTAELHLRHAEDAWPPDPAPELVVLRQLTLSRRAQLDGDHAEMSRAARAVDLELARDTELAALAGLERATEALLSGRRGGTQDQVDIAARRAHSAGQRHVEVRALTMLGQLAVLDGDFRVVDRIGDRVGEAGTSAEGSIDNAMIGVVRAYRALLRAQPAECVRLVEQSSRAADGATARIGLNLLTTAEMLGGAAQFDAGDPQGGLRRMRRARLGLADRALQPEYAAVSGVLEHRAALLVGAADHAREVVDWCRSRIDGTTELHLVQSRAQIALGRYVSAAKALQPAVDGGAPAVLPWSGIEVRLLRARIAVHDGESDRARRLVTGALSDAERLDVWWPFVFATDEVITVLTGLLGRIGASEGFAAKLLARRRNLRVSAIPDPLTDRERAVLRLLPTLRSVEEIAEDLTVSPNTVKTHIRGIYAKLGVNRRRDAVGIAVAQGLLGVNGAESAERSDDR